MIGYTFLGYLLAGEWIFIPIIINTLAILGNFILGAIVNDYFDWKIQKERNFMGVKIQEGILTEYKVLFYAILPIIFIVPLFFLNQIFSIGILPIILFLFFLFFWNLYSAPPFRFKKRKFIGSLISPLVAPLLVVQGYVLLGGAVNLNIISLSFLIFLFHYYIEIMHILEDSSIKEETKKMKTDRALMMFKLFPVISLFVSIILSLYSPIFVITIVFSLVRIFSLKSFELEDILKIRRNLFLPQWSLYEFLVYAILWNIYII